MNQIMTCINDSKVASISKSANLRALSCGRADEGPGFHPQTFTRNHFLSFFFFAPKGPVLGWACGPLDL